ncbi:hypothetical protein BX265_8393 [Streptomyces sp. TLI_235]|nr:hypothetical protein [Streptomyces sp. TLI_235]PBC66324.1 hypothetical protein BX265_8393 [Streptomyces sp. TLI_235]
MTVLVAVAAGVLLGYLAGGRLSHIGETDLAHLWLLGAAGAVNTLNGWMPAARDWHWHRGSHCWWSPTR